MERELTARQILNFEIPASPDYLGIVRKAIVELAANMGFSNTEIDELKLAAGEALSNAVQHCSPKKGDCSIAVTLAMTPEGFLVEITNKACPFCFPPVPIAPDISKERGYGLFLMSHMVDQLDVVAGEHTATVRLIKKPRRNAARVAQSNLTQPNA